MMGTIWGEKFSNQVKDLVEESNKLIRMVWCAALVREGNGVEDFESSALDKKIVQHGEFFASEEGAWLRSQTNQRGLFSILSWREAVENYGYSMNCENGWFMVMEAKWHAFIRLSYQEFSVAKTCDKGWTTELLC